jgi:hypothetical protein
MKVKIYIFICLSVLFLAVFHTMSSAKTLFSEDFSKGADRWEVGEGDWVVEKGEYVQKTTDFFTASFLKKNSGIQRGQNILWSLEQ